MPIKQRHREAIRTLTDAVLSAVATLATGGVLVLDDPTSPVFTRRIRGTIHLQLPDRRIPHTLRRVERRGLVTVTRPRFAPIRVRITEKGYRLLAKRKLEGMAAVHPKRWDGKWRMLMFDVPEKRHRDRDLLRKMIRTLGFYRLQASVWVYPYACQDMVELIRGAYAFERVHVLYIVAEHVEDDAHLRRHFDV